MVDSQYYLPNDIGISKLDCGEAFRLLSPHEKMYAHYLSRASWYVTITLTNALNQNVRHKIKELRYWPQTKNICCLRYGGLVVLLQTSPESANIFVLLQRIFRKQKPVQLEQVAMEAGLSSEEYMVHGPIVLLWRTLLSADIYKYCMCICQMTVI